jgi:hypothetical protein
MATNTNDIDTQWNIPTTVSPKTSVNPTHKEKFDWPTMLWTAAGGGSVVLVIKFVQFIF